MELLGSQHPRLWSIPEGDTERGEQAVQFVRWAGMTLYPWQEDLLRDMCRTDYDFAKRQREATKAGNRHVMALVEFVWAAREVVVVIPRQNGKGEVLVARELCGIYLFGEKTIGHSAHFMDTAQDAQKRLWDVIEANDNLMYWWEDDPDTPGVPHFGRTNGKENITFPTGQQVLFRTRTDKTFRGLSLDLVIFDECFNLPNEINAAMSKTTRAKQRAQRIYISSPVDRQVHMHGAIFSAKRWAGIDGAKGVLYKEWSLADEMDPFDEETWAACNPSLVESGPGAQLSDLQGDAASAASSEILRRQFMVESLGWGDWYPRDGDVVDDFQPVLSDDELGEMTLANVSRDDISGWQVCVDASPDREFCSVAVAGKRRDGSVVGLVGYHGELVTERVVDIVTEVCGDVDPMDVIVDPKSPAWVVGEALDRAGFDVRRLKFPEVKAATGAFLQGHRDRSWFIVDQDGVVGSAFDVAELKADASGGVRWARRDGQGTICQLTSLSYAMWAAQNAEVSYTPVPVKRLKQTHGAPVLVKRQGSVSGMKF